MNNTNPLVFLWAAYIAFFAGNIGYVVYLALRWKRNNGADR